MPNFLLEFLSEEIPARMQTGAQRDGARLLGEKLSALRLDHGGIESFATPRRLAFHVAGLPARQPDMEDERKGPRVGAPQKALDGFTASTGLTLDQCEVREDKKGAYYVALIKESGRPTVMLLPDVIAQLVAGFQWPKSMRWGAHSVRWVRPLHNVMALFDGAVLPGELSLGDASLAFSAITFGHRFRAPEPLQVTDLVHYKSALEAAHVMVDPVDRENFIEDQAEKIAAAKKLQVVDDPRLIEEIAGLVEWPTVMLASIDQAFMALPPEVMRAAMRGHQKYLSLVTSDGDAAPQFIFVANGTTDASADAVIAGNERVLRARLSDAQHFWRQDRKKTLAEHAAKLGDIVFHAKLGTVDRKIDRVQALAVHLAGFIDGADKDRVRSAARLAKADLVTEMVGEFPELQGIIGRYYALADGEHEDVATAIAEHYAPAGPNDACPTAPASVAVALADKLDTLFWLWATDIRPTGSKDPYAMRRAALGVIRLILENGLRLSLDEVFEHHRKTPAGDDRALSAEERSARVSDLIADLVGFFGDRLKVHLRESGVRHDHVAAVFAVPGEADIVRILARTKALSEFLATPDGENLLIAYRRANNIVRQEEARDGAPYHGDDYDPSLGDGDEARLWQAIERLETAAAALRKSEDFTGLMARLATLRAPVDRFFDAVTVNVDDAALRANRLRLLARIVTVMDGVAVFSEIEG